MSPPAFPSRRGTMHRFPSVSEYDTQFRRKLQRRKVVVVMATFFAAAVVVALVFRKSAMKGLRRFNGGSAVHHSNFEVVQQATIKEMEADLVVYQHRHSKTQVMTLVPTDDFDKQDGVFGISFRTPAENDNGAGHVLMHAVWDGSDHYPIKNPVEELKRGSLQTYLEAKTFQDRTTFCAASRHLPDFKNLMNVLMDAVFKPLVRHKNFAWIFREEGWRLERENENTRDLKFNGVTFNEMKGVYDDPDQLIHRYARRSLMRDTHYSFDADGEPGHILDLTHQDVLDYHEKFYHPSNAQVFLYGQVDFVREGLEILDSFVDTAAPRLDIREEAEAHWQALNLENATREVHHYPAIVANGTYEVMVSWLVNEEQMDSQTEYAWLVLEHLLVGTPQSYLKRVLSESEIGTEVVGGMDIDYQQWRFSVGFKGVDVADLDAAEDLIYSTLQQIAQQGFKSDQVEAALNTVEIRLRDQSGGKNPRGILLFYRSMQKWNYGYEPVDAISFEKAWNDLLTANADSENADAKIFIDLLKKGIVDNSHYCVSRLIPQVGLASVEDRVEVQLIDKMRKSLSEEAFTKILAESAALKKIQGTPDPDAALALIPRLSLDEVDPKIPHNVIRLALRNEVLFAKTAVMTSFGMLYVDFGLDIRNVDFEDVHLVPLVFEMMQELGTKKHSQEELQDEIDKYSSGITTEIMIEDVKPRGTSDDQYSVMSGTHLVTKVFLRGRCLTRRLRNYLELLSEIVFEGRSWDKLESAEMLKVLYKMNEKQTKRVLEQGHIMTHRRLEARYSYKAMVEETLMGIQFYNKISDMIDEIDQDYDGFLKRVIKVKNTIIGGNRNGMVFSVTGNPAYTENHDADYEKFLSELIPKNDKAPPFDIPGKTTHPWISQLKTQKDITFPVVDEGIVLPTTVSYVGKGGRMYEVGEKVSGSAAVAAKFLEDGYLYQQIQEDGGAVGAYAMLNFRHGTLNLVSFRDPNIASTLQAYDDAKNELSRLILNNDKLPDGAHEAILATIGKEDGVAPQPDEIGWEFLKEYMRDDDAEYRQKWRTQILNTKREDFVDFINKLLELEKPSVTVLSSRIKFEEAFNTTNLKLKMLILE